MSSRAEKHKGYCPTLSEPMQSGDGWLVRINLPESQIGANVAREVAGLATRYGNGQIDLTSRGNLQIRGVAQEQCETLREAINALGFTDIPRPPRKQDAQQRPALGYHEGTLSLGVLFGRVSASALAWLCETCAGATLTIGVERTLSVTPITELTANTVFAQAEALGFITDANDPRRAVEACPGAPACSSAEGETRALALAIAAHMPTLATERKTIHVSGCIKGCACAKPTYRTISARFGSYAMAMNAKAEDAPLLTGLSAESVLTILTEWEAA